MRSKRKYWENMASTEGKKKHSFLKSLGFAVNGISASMQERNIRIHYFFAVLSIVTGIITSVSATEWLFICTCIGGMIALEMVNTAIEKVVDLITQDYHELAKKAKDISAGAVLVFALYSVVVGVIIFVPKIILLF